ncbi:Predicted signal-transduction protein containing cAMP-binding and CBS domains [uncultured Gammaproteobacteria bacterium]|jgi:CBS domain-containing protein|nr:Predicted signal-transduction protein containing cAMP-binding and CBS domains [uncultured Gammaproteobacteria bacterium]VVH50433.1 Predicted signal-transduction protein containing cAMP-binding and CBS domains [uncultured Gammaproteobacteria bacterium]
MEIEDLEIIDFFQLTLPLDSATPLQLESLIIKTQVAYRRKGHILTIKPDFLYLVRKGAVLIKDENEELFSILGERQWFGYNSQLLLYTHSCQEDTLYYRIDKKYFYELFSGNAVVENFFVDANLETSLKSQKFIKQNSLLANSVLSMSRANDAYLVDKNVSIKQVAKLMSKNNVTSVIVTDKDKLCGIVTDRAFCTKVVALSIDINSPISEIMTNNPVSIAHYKSGVEAMLLMANTHIRHLPIIKNKQVVGMVTAADLLRKQSHNVVFLINEILVSNTTDELEEISKQVPLLLQHSYESNMDEHGITYSVSSIGRSINQQLLKQAEALLGDPPIEYAWVVAGSLARSEQIVHSDQDNLLILADDYQEELHREYFIKLAQYVSDGLNACGYVYCPGDVMATNKKWRQSLSVWKSYFKQWIASPEPKALMYASIFFDLKCIYGESHLLDDLLTDVFDMTTRNTIFQSHMAANALHYTPPLGFFRNFILDKNGANEKSLNLKKKGVVPIVDITRVYALSHGVRSINTQDRLRELSDVGGMSGSGANDLIEAYKFINSVRIKHQRRQIKSGQSVDNFVLTQEISSLDKKHLKDAFGIVNDMQSAMSSRYQTSIL